MSISQAQACAWSDTIKSHYYSGVLFYLSTAVYNTTFTGIGSYHVTTPWSCLQEELAGMGMV